MLRSKSAGYSINRFGVLLTNKPIYYDYLEPQINPTLSFTLEIDDTKTWMTLCKNFVAKGNEVYITLSRFSPIEKTHVTEQNPSKISSLDINKSAYYLIDDLQLFKVSSIADCGCIPTAPLTTKSQEPVYFNGNEPGQVLTGNRFILNNILFDFNKAEIKNSFVPELQKLLKYLEHNNYDKIKIKGYTDNTGTEEYNNQLSLKRAKSIAQWLTDSGIKEERIFTEGFGSLDPLIDNKSEINRKINRRVEIEFFN